AEQVKRAINMAAGTIKHGHFRPPGTAKPSSGEKLRLQALKYQFRRRAEQVKRAINMAAGTIKHGHLGRPEPQNHLRAKSFVSKH
ncbi:MAG TPA: hypothetical protein PLU75_09710, partial [Oscillospiraceae bacterium]|nr:hypothetical protein [Oscillospiraceae bacterium]